MTKIAFVQQGRFGNTLLQYIACKIACLKFGFEYIDSIYKLQSPSLTIFEHETDAIWARINTPYSIHKWQELNLILQPEQLASDIVLHGFFQNIAFLNMYYMEIMSFFHRNNTDKINDSLRICDIYTSPYLNAGDKDIVLHIRLDDFYYAGNNSNVLSHDYYVSALNKIKKTYLVEWKYIWIVIDTIKNEREHFYLNELINQINNIGFTYISIHSKSMLEDWNMCRTATYFISSNSTFAWTAILAGRAKMVVLPNTHFYSHQVIVPFKHIETCIIIETVPIS
jgi:hypothetical protein